MLAGRLHAGDYQPPFFVSVVSAAGPPSGLGDAALAADAGGALFELSAQPDETAAQRRAEATNGRDNTKIGRFIVS